MPAPKSGQAPPWDQLDATDTAGGLLLPVLVQPRASRDRVVGVHDGRLKLQLKAPPVDGAANEAAIAFVAKLLGVPKSDVSLKSGASSRRKTFVVTGTTVATLRERLTAQA